MAGISGYPTRLSHADPMPKPSVASGFYHPRNSKVAPTKKQVLFELLVQRPRARSLKPDIAEISDLLRSNKSAQKRFRPQGDSTDKASIRTPAIALLRCHLGG